MATFLAENKAFYGKLESRQEKEAIDCCCKVQLLKLNQIDVLKILHTS